MGGGNAKKIAIIGGSLAGTMAAILLGRAGHDVTVHERSARGLVGRGGGVTTSRTVLEQLKALDILDGDFPSCPYASLELTKVADCDPEFGRSPVQPALDMHCVHWSGMWENMRKRVPDAIYHNGMELQSAQETASGVQLEFKGGQRAEADILLFADGYHSLGRSILFPEAKLTYRGYTVWRGVVPESEIPSAKKLEVHPRISLKSGQGSFISYLIPDRSGVNGPGQRLFNWAIYFPLPETDLAAFMVDKDGCARTGSIPEGFMRPEQDAQLKAFAAEELPRYYADILAGSERNQLQQIYTADVPAYAKGRMGLLGDAGMMVPPLTGSGLFKGFTNARDLVDALAGQGDVETALHRWSATQEKVARSMLTMGLEMEEAFIWRSIDLATASEAEAEAWFKDAINVAKEFSYFAAA